MHRRNYYGDEYGGTDHQYGVGYRANCNNNPTYTSFWTSRDFYERPDNWRELLNANGDGLNIKARDNRANQLNPNHKSFWTSRGFYERPGNWKELLNHMGNDLNDKGRDNRANQLNPDHKCFWMSRGFYERPDNWKELLNHMGNDLNDKGRDNRANQLNPNHKSFWTSRGFKERPDNWADLVDENNELNEKGKRIRHYPKYDSDSDSEDLSNGTRWSYPGHSGASSNNTVATENTSFSGQQIATGVLAVGVGLLAIGGIVRAFRQSNTD